MTISGTENQRLRIANGASGSIPLSNGDIITISREIVSQSKLFK